MKGVITKYDTGRKFGFIRDLQDPGNDFFFHLSDVKQGQSLIAVGSTVACKIAKGEKGPKAIEIVVNRLASNPYRFFTGAAVFRTVALMVVFAIAVPSLATLVNYLVAINVALFCLTGLDKSSAGGTAKRVPEMILFSFAALGGSAGLLAGMKFFRHKTRMPRFQFFVGALLLVQVLALKWLFPEFTFRRE